MNAPFQVAQLGSQGAKPAKIVKLQKPASGQAQTVQLAYDGSIGVDLSAITNEKITLVHVGERLIILFDNQATLTLDPFFDSTGAPLRGLNIQIGDGRFVTGQEFATLFPVTEDQSVLPAAGPGGNAQGANFRPAFVDELVGPPLNDLMPQEELPGLEFQIETRPLVEIEQEEGLPPLVQVGSLSDIVEEEQNPRSIITEGRLQISEFEPDSCSDCDTDGIEDGTDFTDSLGGTELDKDTEGDFNQTTHQVLNGSLAGLVGGGLPPYAFTIVDLTGQEVQDTTGATLKSHGDIVEFRIDAGNPTIMEGWTQGEDGCDPRLIFRLALNTDGTFDFTLFDRIDHPSLDGLTGDDLENILNIDLTPLVLVTDGAGQTLTFSDDSIAITVIDDVPEAADEHTTPVPIGSGSATIGDVLDDEDTTDDGNQGTDDVGDDGHGTQLTGQLDIAFGRDGPSEFEGTYSEDYQYGQFEIISGTNPLVFSADINDVSVVDENGDEQPFKAMYVDCDGNGSPRNVLLKWQDAPGGGGVLIGYALIDESGDAEYDADDDNQFPVFTLTVDDCGNYSFNLLAPLWHPLQSAPEEEPGPAVAAAENEVCPPDASEYEDNLRITFKYTITDFDGDQKTADFIIEVDDDTPDVYVSGSGSTHEYDFDDGTITSPVPLLNLDETVGPDEDDRDGDDTFNAAEGEEESEDSVESDPDPSNGDLDDVDPEGSPNQVYNRDPDPTGTNPIGRLATQAAEYEGDDKTDSGHVESLFFVWANPGADGLKSLTHHLAFRLDDDNQGSYYDIEENLVDFSDGVATTLQVTAPAEGGNPSEYPDESAVDYSDRAIYLFQVSETEIWGVVGNDYEEDVDGNPILNEFGFAIPTGAVALKIKLVSSDESDGDLCALIDLGHAQIVVEQYMAIDHDGDYDQFDTQLALLIGEGEGDLQLAMTPTITDGDDDSQSTFEPAIVTLIDDYDTTFVAFDDDGPRIISIGTNEEGLSAFNLNLDETIGEVSGTVEDRYNGSETESQDNDLSTPPTPSNGDLDDTGYDQPVYFTDLSAAEADENFGELSTDVDGGLSTLFGDVTVDYGTDGKGGEIRSKLSLVLTGPNSPTRIKTNLVVSETEHSPVEDYSPDSRTVWLKEDGGKIVGYIGRLANGDDDPAAEDFIAFTIEIDSNGQLLVKQYLPIDHDASDIDPLAVEPTSLFDEEVPLLAAIEGQGVGVKLTVTATDGDTDEVTGSAIVDLITSDQSIVSFDDDGPVITDGTGSVTHDETDGVQEDGGKDDWPLDMLAGGDPADQLPDIDTMFDGNSDFEDLPLPLGLAKSDAGEVAFDFGTDGPGTVSLTNASGEVFDGVSSGLYTTDGQKEIWLFADTVTPSLLWGLTVDILDDATPDDVAFAVYLDPADGTLYLVQWQAIYHDGANSPAFDGDGNDHDSIAALAAGLIHVTITDADGDTITSSASLTIEFADDGPSAPVVSANTSGSVTHDETAGVQNATPINNDPLNNGDGNDVSGSQTVTFDGASTTVAALFSSITTANGATPGNDPDVTPLDPTDPIGYARGATAIVTLSGGGFGSDGPAASGSVNYEFVLSSSTGVLSGVKTTSGTDIVLFAGADATAGLILGRVGGASGDVAFALRIDPSNGTVYVVQYLSLQHGSFPTTYDEPVSLTEGALQVKVTYTDGDSDTATSSTINVGHLVSFEDDGPTISVTADYTSDEFAALAVNLDESYLPLAPAGEDRTTSFDTPDGNGDLDDSANGPFLFGDLSQDSTLVNQHIGSLATGTGELAALFNVPNPPAFGADGPGANPVDYDFGLVLKNAQGNPLSQGQGLKTSLRVTPVPNTPLAGYTADDRTIWLFIEQGKLVGRFGIANDSTPTDPPGGFLPTPDYIALIIELENGTDIASAAGLDNAKLLVKQYAPIEHDDLTKHDESLDLLISELGGSVALTLTGSLTDGDGDKVVSTAEVALITANTTFVSIDDDGPDVSVSATVSPIAVLDETIVDESEGETVGSDGNAADDDTAFEEIDGTNPFGETTISSGTIRALFSFSAGTDGEKSRSFGLVLKNALGSAVDVGVGVETTLQVTQPAPDGNPDSDSDSSNGKFTPYANPTIFLVRVDSDTIEGRVGSATGDLALRIEIAANGAVTVQQFLAIAHDTDGAPGTAHDDSKTLGIFGGSSGGIFVSATLTDGDNDTDTEIAAVPLTVNIEDDGITADNATGTLYVDEDGLSGGADDSASGDFAVPDTDLDDNEATNIGSIESLVNIGSDGLGDAEIVVDNGAAVMVTKEAGGDIALKSDDAPVYYYWDGASHTLYGSTNVSGIDEAAKLLNAVSTAVFKVELLSDSDGLTGEYKVTLLQNVDHPDVTKEDDLSLTLTYKVYDNDGDFDTGTVTFTIDDDGIDAQDSAPVTSGVVPTPYSVPTVLDDERMNEFGIQSPDGALGDENAPPAGSGEARVSATGTLNITAGADGLESVAFTNASGAVVLKAFNELSTELSSLKWLLVDPTTRQGVQKDIAVTWHPNLDSDLSTPLPGGGTLYGKGIGDEAGIFVFRLRVEADGDYTFTLFRPLAHDLEDAPVTTSTVETEYEDNLSLLITYLAKDGDGDTDTATLTIQVDDDAPDLGTILAASIVNSPSNPNATETNALNFAPGADGWKGADLSGNTPPADLTVGGSPVKYYVSTTNPSVLIGYIGTTVPNSGPPPADTDKVFTLTVNPGASTSGEYTFTLHKPLDGETTEDVEVGGAFGAGPTSWQIITTDVNTEHLAVVSAWNTLGGGFLLANWKTGDDTGVVVDEVNGGTNGWGVDNQNFNANEILRFDFGAQVDFDEGGAYVPPAIFTGGNVSKATFDFDLFGDTDTIHWVAHYSVGGPVSGQFDVGDLPAGTGAFSSFRNVFIHSAPAGAFLNYIEFYTAENANGAGKVNLLAVSIVETTVDINLNFNVALTDGDDDAEFGTISVNVADESPVANSVTDPDILDDEAQAFGIATNDGEGTAALGDVDSPEASGSTGGTLLITPGTGGVGAQTIAFLEGAVVTFEDSSTGPLQVVVVNPVTKLATLETVTYDWVSNGSGGGTLYGLSTTYSTTGNPVFTLAVTNAGVYTFTALKPLAHSLEDNPGTGTVETEYEDDLTVSFTYTVTDSDGGTDNATLSIVVDDDTPDALNDLATVTEGGSGTADIVFIVDVSGSMDDTPPSPSVPGFSDDKIGLARYSMQQLLTNHTEIQNVQFVKFSDGVSSTVWLSRAAALTYVNNDGNWNVGGNTNYDIALQEAIDEYATSTRPLGQADQTLVYFLSDGAPNEPDAADGGDNGINPGPGGPADVTLEEWEAFLTNPANDISQVFAIGIGTGGGSASVANLEPIAYPNTDAAPPIGDEDNVILIDDANLTNLTQTLDDLLAGATAVTGNVIDGVVDDAFGADGGRVLSITIGAITYVWDGATTIDPSSGANISGSVLNNITTPGNGKLTFNFATGAWSYAPPTSITSDQVENFAYVIVDGDGDQDSATLTITVQNVNQAPSGANNTITFNEDTSYVFTQADFGFTDPDGNALLAVKITSLPAAGTLFFDADGAGSNPPVPVTLNQFISAADITAGKLFFTPAPNANGNTYASFGFAVQDNGGAPGVDLDPTPNTITFNVSPVPDAPETVADTVITNVGPSASVTIPEAWLLANDTDADGNTLDVTGVGGASGGSVSHSAGSGSGGTVTFTDDATLDGAFTYRATDGTPGPLAIVTIDNNATSTTLLVGGAGSQIIIGGSTDDTIRGGAGDDFINGGSGTDLLDFSDAAAGINFTLVQSSSDTVVNLSAANLGTDTYRNMEGVIGSTLADTLTGSSSADTLVGGQGADSLSGLGGNDTYRYGAGDAVSGENIVEATNNGTDTIRTTASADLSSLTVNGSSDLEGGGTNRGIEQILIQVGTTATFSGSQLTGNDIAINESANTGITNLVINVASGQTNSFANLTFGAFTGGDAFDNGADTITINGAGGSETITGTDFNDIINGGAGALVADSLFGGDGDDILFWGANDQIDGGSNASNNLLTASNRGDVMVMTNATVDFTALGDIYQDIETISMRNSDGASGNLTISLNITDVLDMADSGEANPSGATFSNQEALRIDGDVGGDTVNLVNGGGTWVAVSALAMPDAPSGYTAYSFETSGTTAGANETAYLFITTGLTVNIV